MHFHYEVLVDKRVTSAAEVDEITNGYLNTICGYWMIGGRWTGVHDGYDPKKDPRNQQACHGCQGTGKRKSKTGWHPCDVCHGTAIEVCSPGEWAPHKGDVMSVSKIKNTLTCYALIAKGDSYVSRIGEDIKVREKLNELGIERGFLVTIDCHD